MTPHLLAGAIPIPVCAGRPYLEKEGRLVRMNPTKKRILLVLIGLGLLRFVLPLGLAARYYSSTPSLREWVREHPAGDALWAPWSSDIVQRTSLPTAPSPGGPDRFGAWRPTVTIKHGDEVLLDLALELRFGATEVEDWLQRGVASERYDEVAVHATRAVIDRDFHGIVLVSYSRNGGFVSQSALDVFLLAGPGEVDLILQERQSENRGLGKSFSVSSLGSWLARRFAFGFLHPPEDPPDEGIAHHAHSNFYPNWTRTANGSGGAGYGLWEFSTTSLAYSVEIEAKSEGHAPFSLGGSFSTSSQMKTEYKFNGRVW